MDGQTHRPLRTAIAGMGLRGVGMVRTILAEVPEVEIAGLIDSIPGRAELAAEHFGLDVPCFADLQSCLNKTGPEAVAVFTPDATHEAVAVPALGLGLHVYCEKPLATTVESCDRIAAAARAAEGVFFMGQNMRMGPYWQVIHEIVASGEIGELLTLETSEYYYGGRTYFRRWNRLLAVGGGLWLTKCAHDFDMMCWLTGRRPRSVYAVGGRKLFQPKPGAAERCRDCDLRWECDDYQPPETVVVGERGSAEQVAFYRRWQELGEAEGYLPTDACLYRGDIETIEFGSATVRFDGGAVASHTLNVATTPQINGRWVTALGTAGGLRAEPDAGQVHVSFRGTKAARTYDVRSLARGGHGGADARALRAFVRSCRHGETPAATWADGRRAVQLGLAARESMDTGRVVELSD